MRIRSRTSGWGLALVVSWGLASGAGADDWEIGPDSDDGPSTDNALFHGTEQVHDLQAGNAPDQDWYLVSTRPFSSYQVVVFGQTGLVQLTSTGVQLVNAAGSQVFQNAVVTDSGRVLSLQWHAGIASGPFTSFVRIQDPACVGLTCLPVATYRIRFYETTYTVPAVDNAGSRSTALFVQNTTDRSCIVAYHYFDDAGTYLATGPLAGLAPQGLDVVATAATVPDRSGSVRVTHTCGYGALSGTAVTTDASTGLAFDAPLVHRPR